MILLTMICTTQPVKYQSAYLIKTNEAKHYEAGTKSVTLKVFTVLATFPVINTKIVKASDTQTN